MIFVVTNLQYNKIINYRYISNLELHSPRLINIMHYHCQLYNKLCSVCPPAHSSNRITYSQRQSLVYARRRLQNADMARRSVCPYLFILNHSK